MKLILMIGLPGAGKTTVLQSHFSDIVFVSPDNFIGYTKKDPWTPQKAKIAWQKATKLLKQKLPDEDVVFDATFVDKKARKKYINIGKRLGAQVQAIFVDTDSKVCITRNASRNKYRKVPDAVMKSMGSRLERPTKEEGFDIIWIYKNEQFTEEK